MYNTCGLRHIAGSRSAAAKWPLHRKRSYLRVFVLQRHRAGTAHKHGIRKTQLEAFPPRRVDVGPHAPQGTTGRAGAASPAPEFYKAPIIGSAPGGGVAKGPFWNLIAATWPYNARYTVVPFSIDGPQPLCSPTALLAGQGKAPRPFLRIAGSMEYRHRRRDRRRYRSRHRP
jgi:hypothetical protein